MPQDGDAGTLSILVTATDPSIKLIILIPSKMDLASGI
jgi:hypothetical protein